MGRPTRFVAATIFSSCFSVAVSRSGLLRDLSSGQPRIEAGNQSLAGKVRMSGLDQTGLVEQGHLQPDVAGQFLNLGGGKRRSIRYRQRPPQVLHAYIERPKTVQTPANNDIQLLEFKNFGLTTVQDVFSCSSRLIRRGATSVLPPNRRSLYAVVISATVSARAGSRTA